MSCQDFCTVCLLRIFPSHYSICKQHVIAAVQHLHIVLYCFLIFVMISIIGNTIVRVLLYSVDRKPLQFLLSVQPVRELWCIYQNNIWFLKIVVNGFQVAGKTTTLFLFLIYLYSSTNDAEPGKAYRWKGAPVPLSADTCTCKPVVKKISSQDHTPSQRVFGRTFAGTTFLETGVWNLVW